MPYPIDEDKGSAKFNKSKQALVITLPVLPQQQPDLLTPKTPLISEITSPESTNETQDSESHDQKDIEGEIIETEEIPIETSSVQLPDQKQGSIEGQSPQLAASMSVTKEWTSKGDWICPPFSYRQDEVNVCFVLHTPEVKKPSLVSYFDEHYVSLYHPKQDCVSSCIYPSNNCSNTDSADV